MCRVPNSVSRFPQKNTYRFPRLMLIVQHLFQWLHQFVYHGARKLSMHFTAAFHFGGNTAPRIRQTTGYFTACFVQLSCHFRQ